jgi:hypothetical protein
MTQWFSVLLTKRWSLAIARMASSILAQTHSTKTAGATDLIRTFSPTSHSQEHFARPMVPPLTVVSLRPNTIHRVSVPLKIVNNKVATAPHLRTQRATAI